jgi:hypothetical protein
MGRREAALWGALAGVLLAGASSAFEPVQDGPPPGTTTVQMTTPTLSNSDANRRMIAVSAIDVTGNNILYVIDTVNPHIAVYQANGGTSGTQGITLVAARDISLDLQLEGLNDKSEFKYEDLYRTFVENGLLEEE